jgi:hypothetical protein
MEAANSIPRAGRGQARFGTVITARRFRVIPNDVGSARLAQTFGYKFRDRVVVSQRRNTIAYGTKTSLHAYLIRRCLKVGAKEVEVVLRIRNRVDLYVALCDGGGRFGKVALVDNNTSSRVGLVV